MRNFSRLQTFWFSAEIASSTISRMPQMAASLVGMTTIAALVQIAPVQGAVLSNWEFDPTSQELEIVVPGGTTPRYFLAAEPARIVVDLPNTEIGTVAVQQTYGGAVREIRIAQFEPGVTRIVLELAPGTILAPQQVELRQVGAAATSEGQPGDRWVLRPLLATDAPVPMASATPTESAVPVPAPESTGAPAAATSDVLPPLEPGALEIPVEMSSPDSVSPDSTSAPDTSATVAPSTELPPADTAMAADEFPNPTVTLPDTELPEAEAAEVESESEEPEATEVESEPEPEAEAAEVESESEESEAVEVESEQVENDLEVAEVESSAEPEAEPETEAAAPQPEPEANQEPELEAERTETEAEEAEEAESVPYVVIEEPESGPIAQAPALPEAQASTEEEEAVPEVEPEPSDNAAIAPPPASMQTTLPEAGATIDRSAMVSVPPLAASKQPAPEQLAPEQPAPEQPAPSSSPAASDSSPARLQASTPAQLSPDELAALPSERTPVQSNTPTPSAAPSTGNLVEFGQPLPESAFNNLPSVSSGVVQPPAIATAPGFASVATDTADRILLPSGTVLNLRYPGETAIELAAGQSRQEVLVLAEAVRDQAGNVVLPEGSYVIGRFETQESMSQFVAQAVSVQGQNLLVNAESGNLLETRQGGLLRNSALGVAAGLVLGGLTGVGLIPAIAAGAATGAGSAYLTSPDAATIQPNQVVEVKLVDDLMAQSTPMP